jgi:peroxiredoxin
MSQAEIAGGKVSQKGEIPRSGYRLRDFVLKTPEEREVRLSDYRGRSTLILIVETAPEHCAALVRDLASQYPRVREEQAEVLVIAPKSSGQKNSLQLPFPILSDSDGSIQDEYGLQTGGQPISAIFIADRFGELTASYVGSEVADATSASVLKWLEFINSQCPECEPPEWPLENS